VTLASMLAKEFLWLPAVRAAHIVPNLDCEGFRYVLES